VGVGVGVDVGVIGDGDVHVDLCRPMSTFVKVDVS
jgi:hypothetical protein